MRRVILAGDIGGTKTHLALYEGGAPPNRPTYERKLASREAGSLTEIVERFLAEAPGRPERAAFGIAGPVVNDHVAPTNLPWEVRGEQLSKALGGVPVTLMNDLISTAHGLSHLGAVDLHVLAEGRVAAGNRALIAAGTGLGEAIVVRDQERWLPAPSEGGHADFAARNALEDELNVWLRERYGRVSYERVLSGPGLADLYAFLGATRRGYEPADVAKRFAAADDPAALVTETALDGSCERSRMAVALFIEIYGAEAGNLALRAMATGGIYVGGGIAPRLMRFLQDGRFMNAFTDKGRLRSLMEGIRVSVVLDAQTALWGAAAVALDAERS